ncbi:MAG TPA: GxxExxY protein [Bacteroidota bacterium]|nr:GxxExxY protein [Bacteroidota bacterium]
MWDTKRLNIITNDIIGCAIRIHRRFGPILFERVYEQLLYQLLVNQGYTVERQKALDIQLGEVVLPRAYRLDLLVEECVIVEIKAVDFLLKLHEQQLLAYLRVTGYPAGLLINFHAETIVKGLIRRCNYVRDTFEESAEGAESAEEC